MCLRAREVQPGPGFTEKFSLVLLLLLLTFCGCAGENCSNLCLLTCTMEGPHGCLESINAYWFAAPLPFKEVKLQYQALRQKGKFDLVLLVSLLGPRVSLLFAHSCALSCCPQAPLKAISSVALTSVGALQSPDLHSPANKTLAYFSSCFSFQTFWNIMDCAFFHFIPGTNISRTESKR